MNFGQKLRNLREVKGLSTTELAHNTGLSQGYISGLENGSKLSPTTNTIDKLAKALLVPSSYFLSDSMVTPFDILPNMPLELKEFLLDQKATPYMELSKKAMDNGITHEMLDGLLSLLISAMDSRKK